MSNKFNDYKLSSEILKSIKDLGYNTMTEVQEKVLPNILSGKDVIVKSQTGSGKTAAFAIPICEKLNWEDNDPQVLVLAPTRELAIQISEDFKNIGRYKRLKPLSIYGKAPFKEQERALKQKTHIVAGTPGRILDHIDRGTLNVSNIKYLVLDEADEMLNMGFIEQVENVIKKLPKKRQTMLFSATIPETIKNLCKKHMKDEVNVEIERKNIVNSNIEQRKIIVAEMEKYKLLNNILLKEKPEAAVIFCRTKENVDKVYEFLRKKSYSVDKIHGGMMQKDRTSVMEKFKMKYFRILTATDVAARGIDVDNITLVINLDIPMEKESYVHRIGRCGRASNKGKAVTFVTPFEEKFLSEIEEYIGQTIEEGDKADFFVSHDEKEKAKSFLKKVSKKTPSKSKNVGKDITKLYFNGGKKKKIRVLDLVGTISSIDGIESDDIGIIDIQDNCSYVDILNGKGKKVMQVMREKTVKGKKLRVEIAKK